MTSAVLNAGEERSATACPACGTLGSKPPAESHGEYSIVSCASCGCDFCQPMQAAPPQWYEERETYFHRWEFDEFFHDAPHPGGRLLEIGCGAGIFLRQAFAAGYDALGLDFNRLAVATATRNGLRVFRQTLEEFLAGHPEPFDVVTFYHTLEHLSDPQGFLRMVHSALTERGMIALSVPNRNRWTLSLAPREHWDFPPHHLMRFSKEGLECLLTRSGFRVLRMADEPAGVLGALHTGMTTSLMNKIHFGATRALASEGSEPSFAEGGLSKAAAQSDSSNGSLLLGLLVATKRSVFGIMTAPFAFAKFLSVCSRTRGKSGQSLYVLGEKAKGTDN